MYVISSWQVSLKFAQWFTDRLTTETGHHKSSHELSALVS